MQAPIQKLRDSFAFATSTLDNIWLDTHFDLECSTTYVNHLLFPTEFISKCRHSEQSSGRQEPFNCDCERLLVSLTSHNFCLHLKITLHLHKVSFRRKTVLIYKLAPENTNSTRLKKSIFGCSSQVYLSSILIGIFIIVRELTTGRDSDAVFDSTFPNTSLLV